jgi:hypothetical protein
MGVEVGKGLDVEGAEDEGAAGGTSVCDFTGDVLDCGESCATLGSLGDSAACCRFTG